MVDNQRKKAEVTDIAIPTDSNIRKKEHEKLEKYQGLREELEGTVVPIVINGVGGSSRSQV